MKNLSANEEQELRVLELVEKQQKLTQRGIAHELQIAIGLANSLVKRLTNKGFVKIAQIPSGRYAYYLTPEGFFEKSRLVSKYIANSVQFLGEVRKDYEKIAEKLKSEGHKDVGCVGTGEILEIAQLVFQAHNLTVLFVVDLLSSKKSGTYNSFSAVPDAKKSQVTTLILTESNRPHKVFSLLEKDDVEFQILFPEFMQISQKLLNENNNSNGSFGVKS